MVTLRATRAEDAPQIERLYAQSAAYLRALGDRTDFQFSAAVYLRDGFGAHPAFSGLVAIRDEAIVGYLLYTFGYDTDQAMRYLYVLDLLVDEEYRGQGVGRILMNGAAAACREQGGKALFWAVYRANAQAIAFYERLGAQEVTDVLFMSLALE